MSHEPPAESVPAAPRIAPPPLPTHAPSPSDSGPPRLWRDAALYGMTATQFLGAFNDNLFKQLVLLICVGHAREPNGADYQGLATGIFALPFVLFSGFAGWLADRLSKRTVVVACKVAEIGIMLLGLGAFLLGNVSPEMRFGALFVVLGCMGTHSAFFGPAKYGILPELFRERDLSAVNGLVQMTTFAAIIFGMAAAGFVKEQFGNHLWIASGICIGIAALGTVTSLAVRRTPVARPDLPFRLSALAIERDTFRLLLGDGMLLRVLLVSSLFWFLGGVVQQAVNALGKLRLGYADGRTSLLAAALGVGISLGCVAAGVLSRHRIDFRLVTLGAWGMIAGLVVLCVLGAIAAPLDPREPESMLELLRPSGPNEWLLRGAMLLVGGSAGLFVVPLQVFLQARPPEDKKGRMIGAMNFVNWLAIIASAGFYGVLSHLLQAAPDDPLARSRIHWAFAVLALLLVPVAWRFRPRLEDPAT